MANKVYMAAETAITWTDSGGDEILDLGGLASGAGREGEQRDLGSAARAEWYEWRLVIDGFDSAPVVGETINLYFAQSDGTNADGNITFQDAADGLLTTTSELPNLVFAGQAVVSTTTAADNVISSGVIRLTSRYVVPVVHNNTADALLSTADAHKLILTPIPPEVQ